MIFNPFHFFKERPIYKENFLMWLSCFYMSLVGNFNNLGILDYLFVLPGLIKLFNSRSTSRFLSIFMHLTAFALTIGSLLFTYIAYKYVRYKGSKLKECIQEIEVLPVDSEKLAALDYNHSLRSLGISKEKLSSMFYGKNSQNRVKLKDYPNRDQFLQHNMRNHILRVIMLKDENGNDLEEKIFGLVPCDSYYSGLDLSEEHGLYSRCSFSVRPDALPAILIIPSRKNRQQILAMKKFDAFLFSKALDRFNRAPLGENVEEYIQAGDPLKQLAGRRQNIQFTLQQVARHAVQNTTMSGMDVSIDPLVTSITQFAGLGSLDSEDVSHGKKFYRSTLYSPPRPWVTSSRREFKDKGKPSSTVNLSTSISNH